MPVHLHLDPTGGVAGDMFAAAMLDLDPSLGEGLRLLLQSAGLADDVDVKVIEHHDATFRGRRFVVDDPRERTADGRRRRVPGAFVLRAGASAGHAHVPHRDIVTRIDRSTLSARAKERALDIFLRLARAEAAVHGMAVEEVAFHEVGAQDSIADVVTAAVLLSRLEERHGGLSASVASLPLGSGRVHTAHGELPVPAPATLHLLQGFAVHDDGRLGERVTPTGAAIVAHLVAPPVHRPAGVVGGCGIGFGTKVFVGLSNILRVTVTFTEAGAAQPSSPASSTEPPSSTARSITRRRVVELACEIDDMTGEEIAFATEKLRQAAGVVDVCLVPVQMKKGRPATSLRVLCQEAVAEDVAAVLFAVTATLGVRLGLFERLELAREFVDRDGTLVKRAHRPGGETYKADSDDIVADTLLAYRSWRHARENKRGET